MKINKLTEKLSGMGKHSREIQELITISEAHYLLTALVSKYDAIHLTNILKPFIKDDELDMIVNEGLQMLREQIGELENILKQFKVPLPDKPAENINITLTLDAIDDKTIFRLIHKGMKTMLATFMNIYRQCPTSYIRETINSLMMKEMDGFDKFYEYGKLKAYLHESPAFRP